ncbi:MAG: monovalent cation/H(+) antiporter subunit G [Planctomycetota bacterium]
MTTADWAVTVLVFIGAGFALLAAVGIVRMPDLYMRMQSATKAGTLGVACLVAAAALHFGSASATLEATLIVVFLAITAPIASHLIARAAFREGTQPWGKTIRPSSDDVNASTAGDEASAT